MSFLDASAVTEQHGFPMVKIKAPAHISLNNEGQRPRGVKAILL